MIDNETVLTRSLEIRYNWEIFVQYAEGSVMLHYKIMIHSRKAEIIIFFLKYSFQRETNLQFLKAMIFL